MSPEQQAAIKAARRAFYGGETLCNFDPFADAMFLAGWNAALAEAVKICDGMAEDFSNDGDDDAAAAATIVGGAIETQIPPKS